VRTLIRLEKIKNSKIMLDANILLCGAERSEPEYSFSCMKKCYLEHVFSYFSDILLHEAVYYEATVNSEERKEFLNNYLGKNLTIVCEGDLYTHDPIYNSIFNAIAKYDLFDYKRRSIPFLENPSKNRGEVFSLAYAAYHKTPYFSTRDGSVNSAVRELSVLKGIKLVGFEHCLLIGYLNNSGNPTIAKRLKSLYKTYCAPEINRGALPDKFMTFLAEYISQSAN
jgi:hypothetical protein